MWSGGVGGRQWSRATLWAYGGGKREAVEGWEIEEWNDTMGNGRVKR